MYGKINTKIISKTLAKGVLDKDLISLSKITKNDKKHAKTVSDVGPKINKQINK